MESNQVVFYQTLISTVCNSKQILNDNADERTTGTIEAWNLILKRNDHPQHRLRPDVFLKDHYGVLKGRQLAFVDGLHQKNILKTPKVSVFIN